MNPLVVPSLINMGSNLLGGLLGGGKRKTEWDLPPQLQKLVDNLMASYQGGETPGYITNPIKQSYAGANRQMLESMGQALGPGSGLEQANLLRLKGGESRALSEAGGRYRDEQLQALVGLLKGTGTQTTTMGTDWSNVLSQTGGDMGLMLGLLEALKKEKKL